MTELSLHTWTHGEPEDRVLTEDSNLVQPEDVVSATISGNAQPSPPVYSDCDDVYVTYSGTKSGFTSKLSPQNQEHANIELSQPSPVTDRTVSHAVANNQFDNNDCKTRRLHHSTKDNGRTQSLNNCRMEFQHRNKRMQTTRGLVSVTGVPNDIDNRYMILNLSEEETAIMEAPIEPIRRRNIAHSHISSEPGTNVTHSTGAGPNKRNTNHPLNTYGSQNASPYSRNDSDYDNYNTGMTYDDIDQVEDLEELENIPAMDEIPYALLLTGALDDTTLRKAQQKQYQRIELEHIRKLAEIQHNRKKGTSLTKNMMPIRAIDKDKQPSMRTDIRQKSLYESAYEVLKATGKLTQQLPQNTLPGQQHHTDMHEGDASSFSADISLDESLQHFEAAYQDFRPEQANTQPEPNRYVNAKIGTCTEDQRFEGHAISLQSDEHPFAHQTNTLDSSVISGDLQECTDEHMKSSPEIDKELTDTLDAEQPENKSTHRVLIHQAFETCSNAHKEHHGYNKVPPLPGGDCSFISTEYTHGESDNETDGGHNSLRTHSKSNTNDDASVDNGDDSVPMTARQPGKKSKDIIPPLVDEMVQPNSHRKIGNANGSPSSLQAHSVSNTDEEMSVDNEDNSAMMRARMSPEESKYTITPSVDDTTQPISPVHYKETREVSDKLSSSETHIEIQMVMDTNMPVTSNFHLQSSTSTKLSVGTNDVPDTSSFDMTNPSSPPKRSRTENNPNKDTDSQSFIRMKRLERYATVTQHSEQQNLVVTSHPQTNKNDHITKTFHNDNNTTKKPLKAKVFKKPFFELSNEPPGDNNAPASVVDCSTIGPTGVDQDEVKTKLPSAMKYLQNNASMPKAETHDSKIQSTEKARPYLMKMLDQKPHATNSSKRDKNNGSESDNDNQHAGQGPITSMINFLQNVYANRHLSSEKKPATIRFLERLKGNEERLTRSKRELAAIASLLQSDKQNKPKQNESKARNKNVTPEKVTRNNAHTNGEGTIDGIRPPELQLDLKSPLTVSNESTKTVPETENISTAKLRHDAFRLLKQDQSGNLPKCTACGRADCEGQNIKEMKTMVRKAKENEYEIRDVSPDGNCMFAAVIDQLTMYGDNRFDCKSLRDAAVSWLVEHPYSNDGTHYSNFVSCEWQLYLQKMYAEGEWGDHVILGAIVEVVGHIIKIFHVRGDKSFWTVLKPISVDISKDGIHLVLGLVGEFHYTSLRPSDTATSYVPPLTSGSGVADVTNMQTIKLEGGETIDMFRDDYIDSYSEFPVAHFSYLLNTVIPMRYVDAAACCSSALVDSKGGHDTHVSGMNCQIYGPAAEGVYNPKIFSNINYQGDANAMVEAMTIACCDSTFYGVSNIEECHPGFCVLKGLFDITFPGEGIPMPIGANYSHLGYASYLWTQTRAMLFKSWPDSAESWLSRVREESWPSVDTVNSIIADGFSVVPFCHPTSSHPLTDCQILFISAEHRLFREAISKYQKHCFIMFIALCVQTMHDNKSISYRHLKNIFFYACERIPSEYWQTHAGSCVLYMIDSLMRCVKARTLPNYFIDTYNMIGHLTDSDIRDLDERLILLRSQPEIFLKNINSNLERSTLIDSLIERVSQDIPQFRSLLDLKMTSLNVFVPASIDLAQGYIKIQRYEIGYELLSNAFQERLSMSSCDEMVSYQMFITAAVSGLDLESQVWFCAYTDKQLEGQLSKSLIRETCGDLVLTTIQTILPLDICGSFANTEVPKQYAASPCSFCNAFVRFLYSIQKMSDVSSVLQYCHRVFKDRRQQRGGTNNTAQYNDDFNGYNMFQIYTAIFWVNHEQGQLQAFQSVLPEVRFVCQQIGTRWAFDCLKYIYKSLGDESNMTALDETYKQLPEEQNDTHFINMFNQWPCRYPTSY